MTAFNGLGLHLGNLSRLSNAKTRSISPENFTGAPGQGGRATEGTGASPARSLGQGWKVSPSIDIAPGTTATLADIEGPGALQHLWMTIRGGRWRFLILRMFWDEQDTPSVECPVGDFFANGWERYAAVNSLAVCVNPGRAFNCYWEMPFRRRCRVTITNMDEVVTTLYYQIDCTLTDVPDDAAYFHASFRRSNPLPYKSDHTIIDGIAGKGHYVGTYMAWGSNNTAARIVSRAKTARYIAGRGNALCSPLDNQLRSIKLPVPLRRRKCRTSLSQNAPSCSWRMTSSCPPTLRSP
jgi:hypothetical protein